MAKSGKSSRAARSARPSVAASESGSGSQRRLSPESGRRSEKSARSLSVAASELKKQISSISRKLGTDVVMDLLRRMEQKESDDLTRNSAARQVQFGCVGGPRFICYRGPPEAHLSLPLALAEKRFLDFRVHSAATDDVEEMDVATAQELWALCSKGWDDQVKQMTPDVNNLFQKYLRRFVSPTGIGNKTADGVVDGTMVLFDHKLHPADGYFQALDYFRRRFMCSRESGFPRSYGLLVLVASPHIQAVAVVMDWEREKVLAEPLTGFINCFGPEQFRNDVLLLAATLRAVRLFCAAYRAEDTVDPAVPFVLSSKPLRRFKDRLVFLLDTQPPKVAKLTMMYCEEAHRLWAEQKVAPLLYSVSAIGGGWMLVEMAYLGSMDRWEDAAVVVSECAGDPEAMARLTESVRAAAVKGHSTGYVHGDLRLPNIKLRRAADGFFEVMFFDFDWAGRAGNCKYPSVLNPELSWAEGAGFGKLIQPAHDMHFVNTLVKQLQSVNAK